MSKILDTERINRIDKISELLKNCFKPNLSDIESKEMMIEYLKKLDIDDVKIIHQYFIHKSNKDIGNNWNDYLSCCEALIREKRIEQVCGKDI